MRISLIASLAAGTVAISMPLHAQDLSAGASAKVDRGARASASVLSDHHLEAMKSMTAQQQAEFLLERSINRYRGAIEEILARAPGWLGAIRPTPQLESLFRMAINSDDMRVREAAIEINVSARGLARSVATIDRLEPDARNGAQGPRANALWDVGLLGNRGIQPDRALKIIWSAIYDPNENVRYWAVEALAFLGTDAVIEPLLEILHDDRSAMIRERAACGLAQSGMLNERQRRQAVPRLLDTPKTTRSIPRRGVGCSRRCGISRGRGSRRIRRHGASGIRRRDSSPARRREHTGRAFSARAGTLRR